MTGFSSTIGDVELDGKLSGIAEGRLSDNSVIPDGSVVTK